MYIQLSIGRNTNTGRTLNYDEWQGFIEDARRSLVAVLEREIDRAGLHMNVVVEIHEGVGTWPASGREESAHISSYLPIQNRSKLFAQELREDVAGMARDWWQDAIAVVITEVGQLQLIGAES